MNFLKNLNNYLVFYRKNLRWDVTGKSGKRKKLKENVWLKGVELHPWTYIILLDVFQEVLALPWKVKDSNIHLPGSFICIKLCFEDQW